ncbi:nuclear pore complex protein Nup214-like [Acanthaster planci]|uniref:Nuclear pore complex protein Nup214 n=1 Tax=Acanthaster planci TaxID=133434 RepID=A0A8B7XWM4_ACAPL|nr:nuclear pore complex protein Nup214-like [Acanthaster planci]
MAEQETGPAEREVTNLRFHQLTRLKIFDEKPETLTPSERCQLLAVSSKYGYTFVGCEAGLKILKTKEITECSDKHPESPNTSVEDYDCLKVALSLPPVNLALSPDDLTLAVCSMTDSTLLVALFDTRTLVYKSINASPFAVATLSKESDCQLVNLLWNPSNPTLFATCLSDGSMALWDCSEDNIRMLAQLPRDVEPTAICWSPKGKQIVVGTSSGKLIQYNHKLEQKKMIPPADFSEEPIKVVDILWLSTYMFAVAYIDVEETLQPNLTIVSAPKDGQPTYTNFEDICYGSSELRNTHYQLVHLDKWGFILATSSNSMEAAVIGHSLEDKASWEIWTLDDAARIEMPLSGESEDTFPMGLALDLSSESDIVVEPITHKAEPLPLEGERVAKGRAEPGQTQTTKPPVALDTSKPTAPPPIHKSSSTGSFSWGSSSSSSTPSSLGSAATGTSNRSTSFLFTNTKALDSSGQFGKASSAASSSIETTTFTFSGKPVDMRNGSAPKQDAPSSLPPKASPVSTSLAQSTPFQGASPFPFKVPGVQHVTARGLPVDQVASIQTTTQSRFVSQETPDAAPSVSGAPIHPASPSAFATSHQKTALETSSTMGSGSQPQADSVKVPGPPATFGQQQVIQTSAVGKASSSLIFPPAQTASPHRAAPPNQVAPGGASIVPNQFTPRGASLVPSQVAPGGSGVIPNQVAPRGTSVIPNRVAPGSASPVPNQVAPGDASVIPNRVAPGNASVIPNQIAPRGTSIIPNRVAPGSASPVPNQVTPGNASVIPNQIAPRGTSLLPNQVAPSVVPNRPALQSTLPNQFVALSTLSKPPPPAYGASLPQQQAVPDFRPPPTVQAPSTVAAGVKPSGRVSIQIEYFKKELEELQNHTKRAHFEVGERSEQETIKKNADELVKFRAEVLTVTKSHNEEIHELKGKLLATFAQLEDARTLRQRNTDPRYLHLLRLRGLDPQTAKKLRNIHSNFHYLDTGLADFNHILYVSSEPISVLLRFAYSVETVREKGSCTFGWIIFPCRSGDLTSLAAKLSSTQITSPAKARSTPVSSKKQAQLRKALSRRATTPRRTASKVDLSGLTSPALSHSSQENLSPALTSRRLRYPDEEPRQPQPARREAIDVSDVPDFRIPSSFGQTKPGGGLVPLVGVAGQRFLGAEATSDSMKETRQLTAAATPAPPSTYPEPTPSSSTQALPVATTSPSSFTHSGRGTVIWGSQTTPTKTQPSTRAPPNSAVLRKVVEKPPDLPPVVNIKNFSQTTKPPPVTFAPVNSSVDAGTAKVVNQVLAEVAKTSGYSQPEASADSSKIQDRKISFSDEPPPFVQPFPPSKPALDKTAGSGAVGFNSGSTKPPAVQSLPASMSVTPPAATTSTLAFSGSSTAPGPTFSGSVFGAKKEDSSTSAASATQQGFSGLSFGSGFGSARANTPSSTVPTATSALPTSATTAASKPMFGGAGFVASASSTPTSLTLSLATPQQSPAASSIRESAGASATNIPGVKPSLFDFKDQKSAASTSTPGGFFVASTSSVKESIPVQKETTALPTTTVSSTEATTTKPTASPNVSVKAIPKTAPPAQSVQPSQPATATVTSAPTSTSGASVKPFPRMSLQPATSTAPGRLKQLLVGEDEAGTGLASKPALAGSAAPQPSGEDEAGTGQPATAAVVVSDTDDHPPSAVTQPATAAVTTAATGLFGKPAVTPADAVTGTSGGMFGAKAAAGTPFARAGAVTTATATTSGTSAGLSAPSFGAPSSAGLFGAPQFGVSTQPSASVSAPATSAAPMTSAAADKPKTLFGLLKEDQPAPSESSSGTLFGTATSKDGGSVSKNLFGQPTSTSASPFGQSATTSGGLFGQSSSSNSGLFSKPASTTSSGALFGQSATPASSGGLFGQPISTASLFGQPSATSSGGIFGQATSAASSPFQQAGSGGLFETSTSVPTFGRQTEGVFGRPSSSAPAFGQGHSLFGQTPTTTPSSGSLFGAGGDGGGGFFSGLGSRPNPEAARSNPFGSPSVSSSGFGGPSAGSSSLFGNQGATTFGNASSTTGPVFGGSFSSPEGSVAKSGFGGFSQQPSAPAPAGGFGSPPTFGSSPAFGSTPSFGGSAFGSSGVAATSPFGQPSAFGASGSQTTGGFSGFASQETPTFGSLSSSKPQQQGGFSGFGGGSSQSGFGGFGSGGQGSSGSSGFGGTSSFTQYR